jgi:hypothetical protein
MPVMSDDVVAPLSDGAVTTKAIGYGAWTWRKNCCPRKPDKTAETAAKRRQAAPLQTAPRTQDD